LARWAWLAIFVVWTLGAFFSKNVVRAQPFGSRLVEVCFLAAAFTLLFNPAIGGRVLSDSGAIAWAGVVLTFLGAGFTIWARIILGRNWSASVTVKLDHRLMRSGPYAIVRHPIYAGMLVAALGTAMAFGRVAGFAAPFLLAYAWRRKWRLEEQFMRDEFGAEYVEYARNVKAVIPFVW
jgi:protein-S-isoprenylcysteine O-methyltransferase